MDDRSAAPGYCQCGCGTWVGFWERSDRRQGRIKGEPKQFVRGHGTRGKRDSRAPYAVEDRGFDTPCWIWQKSITASGHGQIKVDGRPLLAHRHYYEQGKGAIPKGMELVPLCGARACVNPEHQEVIPKKERNRRSSLAKLDKEQVENIRWEARNTGYYEKVRIAEKHGITIPYLYTILQHRYWAE